MKNSKVQALGSGLLGSIGLGSAFLAISTDFLIAAMVIVIGLFLVIFTMLSKSKTH